MAGGGIGPSTRISNLSAEAIEFDELGVFQERYFEEVAGSYGRNYRLSRILLNLQPFPWKRLAK